MRVLPRLETVTGLAPNNGSDEPPLRSGVAELDTMLHGGLPHGSSTLALGPTGIGKTTLGLQFVGESSAAEPGLIFSFYETPKRICRKGSGLGLNLEQQIADGSVEVLWQSLTDTLLDDIGYRLLGAVRRRGVKRLFVDGIDAIEQASIYPARLAPFLAALANALRDEGVTSIFTSEIPQLVGGEAEIAFGSVSAVAENIMLLRYVEMEASLRRVFSLVKVRESDFDASLRELTITSKGLKLLPLPAPMEGLLTGRAHLQKSTGP
jgi:circadian clock protein KaiC